MPYPSHPFAVFSSSRFVPFGLLLSTLLVIHCGGDDDDSLTCGAGTVVSNGACVPDSTAGNAGSNTSSTGGSSASGGESGSSQAGAAGSGQAGTAGQSGSGGSNTGGTGAVSMWEGDPCPEAPTVVFWQFEGASPLCPGVEPAPCDSCTCYVSDGIEELSPGADLVIRLDFNYVIDSCSNPGSSSEHWRSVIGSFNLFAGGPEAENVIRFQVDPPWFLQYEGSQLTGCVETEPLVDSNQISYVAVTQDPNPPTRNLRVKHIPKAEKGNCP